MRADDDQQADDADDSVGEAIVEAVAEAKRKSKPAPVGVDVVAIADFNAYRRGDPLNLDADAAEAWISKGLVERVEVD